MENIVLTEKNYFTLNSQHCAQAFELDDREFSNHCEEPTKRSTQQTNTGTISLFSHESSEAPMNHQTGTGMLMYVIPPSM